MTVNTSPDELKLSLSGLLAFSLTPFTPSGLVDVEALRMHVELLLGNDCAAVFPAGGTGEFFSLTPAEYRVVVETCVEQVAGRVPVVAGAGYGTRIAQSFVQAAEEAGADGVLVLPPYLVVGPQRGLVDHYLAVADATRLGVIIYQRGATVFEPETLKVLSTRANIIGLKDGIGETERLLRIRRVLGDRLIYMNGMPTAEIHARSLGSCGVSAYSSALLTFMPEVAMAFYRAYSAGDTVALDDILNRAILPVAEIRNRVPGYAVSLIKAGARLRGVPVGSARPPLVDPNETDEGDLSDLLSSLMLDHPLTREARSEWPI